MRKLFLFQISILLLASIIVTTGCKKPKSPREIRNNFLQNFLEPKRDAPLTRKQIELLLYDIKYKGRTSGRALHLGSGYFLTAYHVVQGRTQKIELIPQLKRDKPKEYSVPFVVLDYEIQSDLAILYADTFDDGNEESIVHLYDELPPAGSSIAKFIGLIGQPSAASFKQEYYGIDMQKWMSLYGQAKVSNLADFTAIMAKEQKTLGEVRMRKHTKLYEIEGSLVSYDDKFFSLGFYDYDYNKQTRRLTTIITYDGDSGSPIFYRTGEDSYHLIGTITHSIPTPYEFDTPGHPLGYDGMQLACGVFSHREAVEKLVLEQQIPDPIVD